MIRWLEAILAAFLVRGEIIDHDPGGLIAARAAVVPLEWVEIRGVCGSACTMHLANGCVHPGATLIFHGSQTTDSAAFDHWSAVMARDWRGKKEGKQAEFLVEQSFPWDLVSRIGVGSQQVYGQVRAVLQAAAHKPHVEIKPDWYY